MTFQGGITNVRKIAILRANSFGDLIFVLPALDALRHSYPHAEITYFGQTWHTKFIPGRVPSIDRVIAVPPIAGLNVPVGSPENIAEQEIFFKAMQQEHFDVAFQLHGGGLYSNPFVHQLKPRVSIGLRASGAPSLDLWTPYVFYQNEIVRYLEVVQLAGAHVRSLQPQLFITDEDRAEAAMYVSRQIRPIILLHPGASNYRRCWPSEYFAAVGDNLIRQGASVVVTGTSSESAIVDAVISKMEYVPLNLCGKLSLGGLIALTAQSDLVVTNDTGPMHAAVAVGTRTIGIIWCDNILTYLPLTRKNFYPLISWKRHCSLCGTYCSKDEIDSRKSAPPTECQHMMSLVDEVSPREVIDIANQFLFEA